MNPDDPEGGRWRSDPRLQGYLVAGFGALVVALATGRPELAALGAPFLALAATGLLEREPVALRGEVRVRSTRVLEGDLIEGEARVDWEGVAEIDARLAGWRGVAPVDPGPEMSWSLPAGRGPVTLSFRLRARTWGNHELGALWVRARRPGGLLLWERKLAAAPGLRVLPGPVRLDRLLRPAEPRAVAGMHLSRLRGRGTDFAEMRPYQPGDRLRDLSWGTSARLGSPWVVVHHPERTGTVLLYLDTFSPNELTGTEGLARTARAAWAVASIHLQAQDRVGLLARGVTAAWIPPQGGRRGRWMLLEELLSVGSAVEDRIQRRPFRSRAVVPADALIVGVTSSLSQAFRETLAHHRRTGHTTVALVIDTVDLLREARDRVDEAGRRVWLARREAERFALGRSGVPNALVPSSGEVGPAISSLRRQAARQRVRRGVG